MSKEPIHSGHFMTSNPHSEIQPDDEDEDVEVDVVDVDECVSTAPLDKNAAKEKDAEKPVTFYKFGPQKTQSIAIDVSLNKLNKCIRVAYMKMTTPKWKDFKGIKLQWKHRIRLNNVIWRAYYMEFRKPGRKRRSPYCYFSVPDDDTTHVKIEGSVLEGMYWKRRMEAVCAQYKRWRAYFSRRKRCCRRRGHSCSCDQSTSNHHHLLIPINETSSHHSQLLLNNQQLLRSMTPDNLSTMATECFLGTLFDFDDDMDNEFTNQLFEQLNAPFLFPNPKEETSVQCDNADILQPGLLSLQPSIEEIMSTDYPFVSPEYSSNQLPTNQPIEYSNTLLENNRGRLNSTTLRNQQSQQVLSSTRNQQIPMNLSNAEDNSGMPLQQQQQYTAREYDAANMLLNYSSQAQHLQQQQQQLSSSSSSNKTLRKHPKQLLEATTMSSSSDQSSPPFIGIQSGIPQILTPNISNPLYSQAAAYETQRIAAALSGGGQKNLINSEITDRQIKIGGRNIYNNSLFPPTPMSKIANQTSTTHQIITSVASSSHPSHFSSPINYSLLAAATSNSVNHSSFNQPTNLTNKTLSSTLSEPNPIISQWSSSWGSQQQQQQQTYPFLQQSPSSATLVRKTSGNNVSTPTQQSSSTIHSPNISVRNFSTQSLLSSNSPSTHQRSFPSNSLVASLVSSTTSTAKQLNEQQSILSSHLLNKSLIEQKHQNIDQQQKIDQSNAQLLQSLTEANNNNNSIGPQQTVKRFVMSDLSRYLTQQTPIITNSSLIQSNDKSTFVTGSGQNTLSTTTSINNCSSLQNNFSPPASVQQQQYSPSIINNNISVSIPIQQINEIKGGGRGQKQYVQQQQQTSPNSTNIVPLSPPTKTTFSPPQQLLQRKMSVSTSSAFSSPNNNKKGRGSSFSSSSLSTSSLSSTNQQKQQRSQTTTTHLGKRQQQQQQNNQLNMSPPQKQQILLLQQQQQNTIVENNVCLAAQASTMFIDEPEFATLGPANVTKRRNYKSSPQNSSLSPPIIIPSQQQQIQTSTNYFKHLPPSNEAILLNSLIENNCNNITINEELKQHKLLELGQFKQNLEVKKENGVDNNNLEENKTTRVMISPFSSTNDALIQDDNLSSPYFSSSTTTILTGEEDLTICTNSAAADSTLNPDERKRILHLNAEKNRRSALKEGFDCLVKAIPLVEQAGLKSTNAVVLNRAAQHIKNLKLEQERQLNQMKIFKEKITCMNERIAMIQSNLPSSNLSGSKTNDSNSSTIRIQVEQFFERYKRDKSQEDYRFWLMGEVLKPIVHSFAEQIYPDGTNRERLVLSARKWLDTHWNSAVLRPIASDTLVRVATAGGAFTTVQALNCYVSQQINQEVLPSSSSSTSSSHHPPPQAISFIRKK
ncbi:hypothetical protein ACQ4LE_011044 [Meloidogyne hapla]|uniref:BHLH domain-containing protein n=1 Tax=Meloidogyne hapla TaxID=6305 RepID=A0A1I8B239_MELHA